MEEEVVVVMEKEEVEDFGNEEIASVTVREML